jgi:hypothetical protein
MWPGVLWLPLFTAALLCYPRRPRLSGGLWILLGLVSLLHSYSVKAKPGVASGVVFVAIGIWYLVKYRNAAVRAKHVAYWTARA